MFFSPFPSRNLVGAWENWCAPSNHLVVHERCSVQSVSVTLPSSIWIKMLPSIQEVVTTRRPVKHSMIGHVVNQGQCVVSTTKEWHKMPNMVLRGLQRCHILCQVLRRLFLHSQFFWTLWLAVLYSAVQTPNESTNESNVCQRLQGLPTGPR